MKTKEKSRLIIEKEKKLSELTESVCIFLFLFFYSNFFLSIDQHFRTKIQ
jgi:hypothetical protein